MAGQRVGVPANRAQTDVDERPVHETVSLAEHAPEDEGHSDRHDDERQQDAHAPERLVAQIGVERGGDGGGEDELRDGGEQEDAQRVAQGDPELALLKDECEVVESRPPTLAAQEVPCMERDPGGVEEGKEADQREQDEERRDEQVGRVLEVPPTEVLPQAEAAAREVLDHQGRGCHKKLLGGDETGPAGGPVSLAQLSALMSDTTCAHEASMVCFLLSTRVRPSWTACMMAAYFTPL